MTPNPVNQNSNGYKIPGAPQEVIAPWGERIALWYRLDPDPTDRFKSIQTPGTTPTYVYDGQSSFTSFNAIADYKTRVEAWRANQARPDFNKPLDGYGSYPVGAVTGDDAVFLEWCGNSGQYRDPGLLFYEILDGPHAEIAQWVAYGRDHGAGFDPDTYQGPMRDLVAPFKG